MSLISGLGGDSGTSWNPEAVDGYSDGTVSNIFGIMEESIDRSDKFEKLKAYAMSNDLEVENVAFLMFRRGKKIYGQARREVEEIQDQLEQEMETVENLDERFAGIEVSQGDSRELDQKAEKRLEEEKRKVEGFEADMEERESEIKQKFMKAEGFFQLAEEMASNSGNRRKIDQYITYVKHIDNYNIFKDLEIEEEDLENFIEESEEIMEKRGSGEQKSGQIKREVKEAEKKFVKAERPVRKLPKP
jgi:chromosome segregation ATPase